ncbi:uncharacterized protein G2W53_008687 [Senna tora]|uniref:Uncharacterized protein n=1 Tax=Senna tora TaxID=362788 RepID=A0A834X8R0_9FABA|nr:uncharacterized protein G2W53_008687 [Senna tora]
MDGLLPMVYKAMKKNRTRREYQRLPSGAASHNIPLINMSEIYPQSTESHVYQYEAPYNYSTQRVIEFYEDNNQSRHPHRRPKSVGDFGFGFSSSSLRRQSTTRAAPKQQLVRFRSQRMFSCITGV